MSEWEPVCFAKRHLQTTKWKNTKINCKTTGGVPTKICGLHSLKIHPVLCSGDGCPVPLTVCYKLVFCRKNWPKCKNIWVKKNFSQCHSALNFWRQVPESEHPEFKIPVHYSFLCIAQHIAVKSFLCNEVRKIKPPHNPEKWTLGRINSHNFNNILSRFSGTRKSNKNFIPTITVHHTCKTRILYRICIDTTKWFCGSLVFLILCKWLFHWTSLPTPAIEFW